MRIRTRPFPALVATDPLSPAAQSGVPSFNNPTGNVSISAIGASFNAAGTQLTVNFSGAATGFEAGANGFAVATAIQNGALTLSYASGDGSTSVVFTTSRTVYDFEGAGSVSYTPGAIIGLDEFAGQVATNNSTQQTVPSTTTSGTTGDMVITMPTNNVVGSTGSLVVVLATNSVSPAAPSGWTRIQSTSSTGTFVSIYQRTANGTASITFTGQGQSTWRATAAFDPYFSATLQGSTSPLTGNGPSCTCLGRTVTGANRRLWCTVVQNSLGSGTLTAPGDMTGITNNGATALILAYSVVNAGATGNKSFTSNNSTAYFSCLWTTVP